jgi:hypothetical protein
MKKSAWTGNENTNGINDLNNNIMISSLLLSVIMFMTGAPDNPVDKKCQFKGFNLYGKIKVVTDFPDIKVKIVENFPDLKVQVVENFPDQCGKWKFVTDFPDIKIKFVTDFPDIKVKFVENFPGTP